MAKAEYIPTTDGERLTWFANFAEKLPRYTTELEVNDDDLETALADCRAIIHMIYDVSSANSNAAQRVRFKQDLLWGRDTSVAQAFPGAYVPPDPPDIAALQGVVYRIRALVRRMKTAPQYTAATGSDLGIIARSPAKNPADKPVLTGVPLSGMRVEIRFAKRGFDAVFVESKRGNETDYAYLGTYLRSPFVDSRAALVAGQSEQRTYRATYLRGNEAFGMTGEPVVVTTVP